jgi:drug/metabolite transporter (DMT)-like permease
VQISPTVMLAVLGAALLHAAWNALLKASADKDLENAALALGRLVLGLLMLPWLPVPEAGAFPWMAASAVVHIAYFWALAGAYRAGDLSFSYPIMRGGAPVLVTAAGAVFLGEVLPWRDVAAVALVCAGILGFAARPRGDAGLARRALMFALANAVVIACYTLIDAQGARAGGSALAYAVWLLTLNGIVQAAMGLWAHGRAAPAHALRHWPRILGGAAFSFGSYAIVLWAMTRAPVALVAVLRESSVLFAAAIGALFLGERFTRQRAIATVVMLAGLVTLRL